MNYTLHYNKLIDRARERKLEGYSERHHIIPKCMGGSNDKSNLVRLTAEEHYVAHQLLVKIYPDNHKLIYAVHRMCSKSTPGLTRNNKMFGWLKRKHAAEVSAQHKGNKYRAGMSPWCKGLKMSDEHRKVLSLAHLGHKDTDASKLKKSVLAKQRQSTPEYKLAHSKRMTEWWTKRKEQVKG